MSVPRVKSEREFQGTKVMAYVLMILGVALIPVGIVLTLVRETDEWRSGFPYMPQGAIIIGVGLFLIFLTILLMLVAPWRKRASPVPIVPMPGAPQGNLCASCSSLLMWIPAQQRWYCNSCKEYR
jgi:hypothetical protein